MNILIISDFDRLPLEIAKSLISRGYNIELITTKDTEFNFSVNISELSERKLWLKNATRSYFYRNILLNAKPRYSFFQDINENSDYYESSKIIKKVKSVPDVILVLFDYRILTTNTLNKLYAWSKAKIVWMIPDMKPMTGGCSYAGSCEQYQFDCSDCPAIGSKVSKIYAKETLRKKMVNLSKFPFEIISGSTYQQQQAQKSSIFKDKKIHRCFFPSNSNIFKPMDRSFARDILGINTEKKIILFGATSLLEERKGMKFVLKALKNIEEKYKDKCLLLIVGNGDSTEVKSLQFEKKILGFLSYEKLANAYQAADFFVCPTIDDSGPVMVSQSIMCGTPVVSFKMGISIDLVKGGSTGVICELENEDDLANGIIKMMDLSEQEEHQYMNNCIAVSQHLGFDSFIIKLKNIIDGK